MKNITVREAVTSKLREVWLDKANAPQYDHVFHFTGKDSPFNNGFDDIYKNRLEKQRELIRVK